LGKQQIFSVLDYGAEGKTSEEEFDFTLQEAKRAIDFAQSSGFNPFISTKLTGLVQQEILENIALGKILSEKAKIAFDRFKNRVDSLCALASQKNVSVLIDAEESWIQDAIDQWCFDMMLKYNQERAIVFNTIQMYRHDRLEFLKASLQLAEKNKVKFIREFLGYNLSKNGKRYNYGGLLEKLKGIRISDNSFLVPHQNSGVVEAYLQSRGVDFVAKK
jgi:proline dehydrogenase